VHILVIMFPNHSLHRLRTSHRRLPTHQPRSRTKGERETLPEGIEESRSDAVLGAEEGGGGEVVALGGPHFLPGERASASEHRSSSYYLEH